MLRVDERRGWWIVEDGHRSASSWTLAALFAAGVHFGMEVLGRDLPEKILQPVGPRSGQPYDQVAAPD
jgi:hypothetical protein